MRKFLVYYRIYLTCGEYEYNYSEIELDDGEKANVVTFGKKLNSIGCGGKEVLSWSLIEE
jgi:hypothetical protein